MTGELAQGRYNEKGYIMQMRTKSELDRMAHWYKVFNSTTVKELCEVYRNPSQAKRIAFERCLRRFDGKCFRGEYRIIAHTSSFFTFAYTWGDCNGEVMFTVETYANTYTCSLADMGY